MEVKISTQLKKLRRMLNLTQSEFGEKIGVTQANISLIEKEDQDISAKTLNKIKEAYPGINFNWLHSNVGQPFIGQKENEDNPLEKSYRAVEDKDLSSHKQIIDELNMKLKKMEQSKDLLEQVIRTFTNKSNTESQN